jgi:transposase
MSLTAPTKLTPECVLKIRERTANRRPYQTEPLKSIASEFGVSVGCIHSVITRRTWNRENLSAPSVVIDRRRKLTEEQVREIRRLREQGEKLQSIATDFGVCFATVRNITLRQIWKHVA